MRLVAGWAREAGLEPALDRLRQPVGAAPRARTARSSPRARTSTPCPTAAATTARWGPCWASRWPPSWAPGAGLLICAAEEAPRFGAGTIGSRQMVGNAARRRRSSSCTTPTGSAPPTPAPATWRSSPTCRGSSRRSDRLRAHAEVHVAQRRALRELGVVTAVASPRRFAVAHRRRGRPLRRGVDGRPPRRAGGRRRGRARRRGGGARRAGRDRRHRRHAGGRARRRQRHPGTDPHGDRRARHRVGVAGARGVGHPRGGGRDRHAPRRDGRTGAHPRRASR